MLVFSDLKPFFRSVMRYAGNGYLECQISKIPEKKRHKVPHIDAKMRKHYMSDLTQGQRQYRRKKGLANYTVLRYRNNLYVVLKSPGKDTVEEKWRSIYRAPMQLGAVLKLQLHRDEKGKNTVKLSRDLLKETRSKILTAIEKKNGRQFHKEITKLYNLSSTIPYRGLNMQISDLLKDVRHAQKKHGTRWSVPVFFKKNRVT